MKRPSTIARIASKRQFPINVFPLAVLAIAICLLPKSAHAKVIDFEDAVPTGFGWDISNGYQGFTWAGSQGSDSWVLATPTDGENIFHAHSGVAYAWSNGGAQLSMSGGVFDFNSFWAATFAGGQDLIVNGYLAGNLVYSSTVALGSDYQEYTFNYVGVDTVVFPDSSAIGQYNLMVDDISVNSNSSVPDGGTVAALLGSALLGLAALRRKFAGA